MNHPTKTYRGKPACLGSGAAPAERSPYGNAKCPECPKWVSATATGKVNTHLPYPALPAPPTTEMARNWERDKEWLLGLGKEITEKQWGTAT